MINKILGFVKSAIETTNEAFTKGINGNRNNGLKSKMQSVCKAGNKLRKVMAPVVSATETFNCGVVNYGACGCPKFMVDTLDTPLGAMLKFNEKMKVVTDNVPVGVLDDIYDFVCDNVVVNTWTEIKGIVWDTMWEDVLSPINTLLTKPIRIFGTSFTIEGLMNAAGVIFNIATKPLEPLINSLVNIFMTPIENMIVALMEKVAPAFNFEQFGFTVQIPDEIEDLKVKCSALTSNLTTQEPFTTFRDGLAFPVSAYARARAGLHCARTEFHTAFSPIPIFMPIPNAPPR